MNPEGQGVMCDTGVVILRGEGAEKSLELMMPDARIGCRSRGTRNKPVRRVSGFMWRNIRNAKPTNDEATLPQKCEGGMEASQRTNPMMSHYLNPKPACPKRSVSVAFEKLATIWICLAVPLIKCVRQWNEEEGFTR